jgi:ubiquinone/menaquinone biosynthesis C-methylase UbiE
MSSHGADWLERPEREAEERPQLVLDAMQLREGDVVAEIGAGTGYFARRIARAVGPRGIVYANDIQPEMLDLMRTYAAREQLTNIRPVLGTETDPKLPANTLDWILLADVYHEFQQPRPMLARMREALKPTGRVMLVEYRGDGTTASDACSRIRGANTSWLSCTCRRNSLLRRSVHIRCGSTWYRAAALCPCSW